MTPSQNVGVTIRAEDAASPAIKSVATAVTSLGERVTRVATTVRGDFASMEQAATAASQRLNAALASSGASMEGLATKVMATQRVLADGTTAWTVNAAKAEEAAGGFKSLQSALVGLGTAMPGNQISGLGTSMGGLASAASAVGVPMLAATAGVAAFAIEAGDAERAAASFNQTMTLIRNNTDMTDAEFGTMVSAVKDLASTTGSSTTEIADGFRHLINLGYSGADAMKILAAGNELAVATGANVGDTTNRIASIMKEFGISADEAGRAENTMFQIAAQGNVTFQQLADFSGRLFAVTGALKGGLTDIGAAYDALTRHGFDAAQAQTQLLGIMQHIVNPTSAARAELARLDAEAGTNLVKDFSMAGLQTIGLTGILDELQTALHGNTDEVYKLITARRGGDGTVVLLTTGNKDLKESLSGLTDTMSGKATPATEAFGREMDTTEGKAKILHARMGLLQVALGQDLQAAVGVGIGALLKMGDAFDGLGGHIAAVMGTQVVGGFTVGDLLRAGIPVPGGGPLGAVAEGIKNHFGGGGSGLSTAAPDTSGDFAPHLGSSDYITPPAAVLRVGVDATNPLDEARVDAHNMRGRYGRGDTTTASTSGHVSDITALGDPELAKRIKANEDAVNGVYAAARKGGGGAAARAAEAPFQAGAQGASNAYQQAKIDVKTAADQLRGYYQPSIDATTQSLHDQQAEMRTLNAEYATQKGVVTDDTRELATQELQVKRMQQGMRGYEDAVKNAQQALSDLNDKLSQAKQQESDFNSAVLAGTRAFTDQQGAMSDQQAAIQLQIDQAKETAMASGMSSSDIDKMPQVQALTKQLDLLRLQQEEASLQHQVATNPLQRQIDDIKDAGKEMSFDQIVSGLQSSRAAVASYEAQLPGAQAAVTAAQKAQQAYADSITASSEALDDLRTKRQKDQEELDRITGKQDKEQSAIDATTTSLTSQRDAYKSATDQLANETNPTLDIFHQHQLVSKEALEQVERQFRSGNIPTAQQLAEILATQTTPRTEDLATALEHDLSKSLASTNGLLDSAITKTDGLDTSLTQVQKDAAKGVTIDINEVIHRLDAGARGVSGTSGGSGPNGEIIAAPTMNAADVAAQVAMAGQEGFDAGGIIPGGMGQPQLILAHGGEVVLPRAALALPLALPPALSGGSARNVPAPVFNFSWNIQPGAVVGVDDFPSMVKSALTHIERTTTMRFS